MHKLPVEKVHHIITKFLSQSRHYVIALDTIPTVLKRESISINLSDFDSIERAVIYMQHYWGQSKNIVLHLDNSDEKLLIDLIKVIFDNNTPYLVIDYSQCSNKVISLLRSIGDIEKIQLKNQTLIKANKTKDNKNVTALDNIIRESFSFHKKRSDDKKLIDSIRGDCTALVDNLYHIADLTKDNLLMQNHLIRYLDKIVQILGHSQSSYLQGRLIKWLSYDFVRSQQELL